MQIQKLTTILLLVASVILAGCGPKVGDPSEANFKQALNAYFSKLKECIAVGNKPDDDGIIRAFRADGKGFGVDEKNLFDALTSEGLLETVNFQKELPNFSGSEIIDHVGYKLTDNGQTFRRPAKYDDTLATGAPLLCYASAEVIDITGFTQPAEVSGVQATNVKFTYHLIDVATWASNPALVQKFGWVQERVSSKSLNGNEDLVLTDTGWVHHSQFVN